MIAAPTTAASAMDNLNRALRRWERLSAPPRHLDYPVVSDLSRTLRVVARLRDRGQHNAADDLSEQCALEYDRLERVAKWAGRSAAAWHALADRLDAAIAYAEVLAGLAGDSLQCAVDRLHDAESQARWADHLQSLN